MNLRTVRYVLQAWKTCDTYINMTGRPRPHFDGEALNHYLFMKELAQVKREVLHNLKTAKEYFACFLQFLGIATATALAMFIIALIK